MITCRSFVSRFATACALALGVAASAQAATLIVTTAADVVANGDGCSLREALINANTNSRAGSIECAAGQPGLGIDGRPADTILLLPATTDLAASATDDELAAVGDLDVVDSLRVWGGGAQFSVIDGGYASRLFDVQAGATLVLRGMYLTNGEAAERGGAIQVNTGAVLELEDVTVGDSRISPFSVGGRGAGVYLAPGARGEITRSAIMSNSVLGVDGMGAGLFCERCTLSVRATTIAGNTATAFGGGLFVTPDSNVDLAFATFGFNRAVTGSAVFAAGDTDLFAVVSSENGNGLAGDDLKCSGGLVTAAYTYVEFPSDCATVTGITARADLVGTGFGDTALQPMNLQRFDGQPSSVLYWDWSFHPVFKGVVPSGECNGHRDQFGRTPVAAVNCDIGAQFHYVMVANPMYRSAVVGGDDVSITIGTDAIATEPTVVRFKAVADGVEACDLPPRDILFPGGSYGTQILIDPDTLFTRPAMGRPYRVCEMQAQAIDTTIEASVSGLDGHPGDRALVGSSTGVLRVLVNTKTGNGSGLSTPQPGTFLNIGTVPVGAGGAGVISFRPPQAGWSVVAAAIDATSPDPDRFSFPASLPLALDAVGGTQFPITCNAGQLGEFEAFVNVTLVDHTGALIDLVYGVRCRVAHTLSMSVLPLFVDEGESPRLTLMLDSPSILAAPLVIDLAQVAGDALAGVDFADFTGVGVVTFQPGEQRKEVTITTVDDESVEPDEMLVVRLEQPADPDVVVVGGNTAELRIVNNDVSFTGLELSPLSGVPARSPAGSRNPVTTVLRNTSHVDAAPLGGVRLEITVDKPVWVYSFVARRCASSTVPCDASTPLDGWIYSNCSVAPSQRMATCVFPQGLRPGEELEVSAIVEMAEINEAPTLDVSGIMRISASANVAGGEVGATVEAPYIITGKQAGGGSLGLWTLLVASGLALRGSRKRSGGGRVRPGVVSRLQPSGGRRRICAAWPKMTLLEKKK